MTLRAILLATGVTFLVNLWIRHAELVTGRYVSVGVPPPPAVTALLLLVVLGGALRPLSRRLSLSRAEVLTVYAFLSLSVPLSTFGVVRAFFPCLTVPFYYATPENHFQDYWRYLPEWFAPRDPEIIRSCYEGADSAAVPWLAWARPLALWSAFFVVFFGTMLCVVTLFRKQWVERDRLSFPLLYLPVEMTEVLGGAAGAASAGKHALQFFRDPIMWAGFSLAVLYNFTNILSALNPSVPALGARYDIGELFTERPLNALQPLTFHYLLELIGLGYLVPTDMLFSMWFFYGLSKVLSVFGRVVGYEPPGFPYQHEQSAGAYVGMTVLLIWLARVPLRQAARACFRPAEAADADEAVPPRWALLGACVGFALLLAWCRAAGMSLLIAFVFFATLFGFALVCGRVRGEAGLPVTWPFPYDQQKEMWFSIFGSERLAALGGWRSLTLLASFSWLSRHLYPTLMAQQFDNLKLADSAGVSRRRMASAMWLALVVGLGCAYWIHLSAYYEFGQNILEGNPLVGDYRTRVAVAEFTRMLGSATVPRPPDPARATFVGLGFFSVLGVAVVRYTLVRFPLHPLGYAVGLAYSSYSPYWGPCLLVWSLKLVILRLGGAALYKRLIPGFLGLAFGHYFMGGIVWPTVSTMLAPEISQRYHFAFGG